MAKVTKDEQPVSTSPTQTETGALGDVVAAGASVVDATLPPEEEAVPEVPAVPPQTGDRLVCPTCGLDALVERRTPDHATHYTVVCNHCGYRATFAG